MYLTVSNLAPNLIARGLITAQSVVDGDFVVVEAGRRNRNFKVIRKAAPGLFVKQVKSTAAEATSTWRREAAFYQLIRTRPGFSALSRIVPQFIDANPSTYSLIVGLMPDAENLTEYHFRLKEFPEAAGEMIGRGLGAYHSQADAILTDATALPIFPKQLPWVLNIGFQSPDPITLFGSAGQQFGTLLQQHREVMPHLAGVRYEWRMDSLIHGDMKWDNCVIYRREDGEQDFCVVDWELADLGDAAWDAGSIFASYLAYWLFAMPQTQPPETLEQARSRLERMQPALRAFWRAYAAARHLTGLAARQYLSKCVRFGAARLILTAFEYTINIQQVNANVVAMIQIGRNIFLYPDRATQELMGIEQA